MARVEISLTDQEKKQIQKYCQKHDLKVSQLLRQGAKKIMEEQNDS